MGEHARRLKELVEDYYHGLVTFESYRQQRRRLLDSLEDEAAAADASEDRAGAAARDPLEAIGSGEALGPLEAIGPGEALGPLEAFGSDQAIDAGEDVTARRRGGPLAAGAAAVLVAAALALYVYRDEAPSEPALVPAGEEPAISPEETLLVQFLSRDDWSVESVRNFELAWGALRDAQRASARETASFGRFEDVLQRRLQEEEALGRDLGNAELASLLALATRMEMPFAARLRARLEQPAPAADDAPRQAAVSPPAVSPPAVSPPAASPPAVAGPDLQPPDPAATEEQAVGAEGAPASAETPLDRGDPEAGDAEAGDPEAGDPEAGDPGGTEAQPGVSAETPAQLPGGQDGAVQASDSAESPEPLASAESPEPLDSAESPEPLASAESPEPLDSAESPAGPRASAEQNPQQAVSAETGPQPGVSAETPASPDDSEEEPRQVAAATPAEGAAAAAAAPSDDPCRADLALTRRPYCQDALAGGGMGPPLAILPAGEFEMGSERSSEESPPHGVTIPDAFAMSIYEVSFAEFTAYCRTAERRCPENPWDNDGYPVVDVSWEEAAAYAEWLSAQSGYEYRLPSEAEWEYAARAGTTTPYFFGSDITPTAARSSANVSVESPLDRDDRVVNRNDFRLFHMAGNVREWVADTWHESHEGAPADGSARLDGDASRRVVRGGSFADPGFQLRSAAREPLAAGTRDTWTGFRVARRVAR